ncbi:MFS transporter [Streptomyces stelliscabiei]|uniref:MFS transporter n=1 Tax=Streptomyces stelliscabiei TaxID=146820 RepID=UPI0029A70D89|nr:MFS transporter [Streptomyces stelliscabiei]MDX2661107.1 MFS transporter [Streptomyces stelliscabiei]MDX2715974.1 MFS transporter [Streptomyces stelliscabiei]MDX2790084.1 MFS transporter [Streptomyces stelliscabiei]
MPHLLPAAGPQRVLAVSNFVYTIGSGLYLTAGVLYFTEAVHLPANQVGLGLGIAGLAALALGVAVGHLADQYGARGVYALTLIVQALATAAFVLIESFWPFVVVVCAAAGAKAAGIAARSPLIRHYGGDRPQEFRAYLRAVTNVGVSFGAVLAGWAVQVGTLTAYQLMAIGNAIAFAVSAALLVCLPPVAPVPGNGGPRWSALRDGPYLLLTALDGVMAIQFKVLTVAIPLWLVGATRAPHWLISGTMLTGTVIVVAFQVRASRNVDSPTAGASAYRRAGVAFLIACSLISLSAGIPAWAATTLLLAAVVIHTVGELWHSAAGFEISFALAPRHATGQYLGVFGLGAGLAEALGPGLLIALCITWGRPGWYVVGALFALTGLGAPPAVRWAQHHQHGRQARWAPAQKAPTA